MSGSLPRSRCTDLAPDSLAELHPAELRPAELRPAELHPAQLLFCRLGTHALLHHHSPHLTAPCLHNMSPSLEVWCCCTLDMLYQPHM